LVIDDNAGVREMLSESLRYSENAVKAIPPSKNFREVINDFHPDIVLLDYVLQTMDGSDLCHELKSNEETARIPVVMISAYVPLFSQSTVNDCDAILSKPFDLDELLETVDTLTN
jgi:DNA-binding response OmpR family regulator